MWVHLARDLAEAVDALPPPLRRLISVSRHRDPRHAKHEARIDAVVAGLDAFAGKHAGIRPLARGLRAVTGAQDVDDAGDHRDGLGVHAAGAGDRADFDAFAAAGAGVRHRLDACGQRGFESGGHAGHELSSANSRPDYCFSLDDETPPLDQRVAVGIPSVLVTASACRGDAAAVEARYRGAE